VSLYAEEGRWRTLTEAPNKSMTGQVLAVERCEATLRLGTNQYMTKELLSPVSLALSGFERFDLAEGFHCHRVSQILRLHRGDLADSMSVSMFQNLIVSKSGLSCLL
jgi:hypothetical protein